MGARYTPQKFWNNVYVRGADDCWPWLLAKDDHRYGRVRYHQVERHASRQAWILTHGEPGALFVLHKCDNPPCCNPAHLFLGNHQDNSTDMCAKGRHPRNKAGYLPTGDRHHGRARPEVVARGERNGAAVLTEEQVREIRAIAAEGLLPQHAIAARFGVARATVTFIVARGTWRHVA